MGVKIKKVVFEDELKKYGKSTGIILCMDINGYYINYFDGINGPETLASGMKTKEEAKEKFLDLVWDMS